jgi:copper(I)-binding protein
VKYRKVLLLILAVCLTVAGQSRAQTSPANAISIEQPWARATPVGARTGAAYVTIVNHGSSADRLIRASTPLAEKVQFHQENDDNGIMRMREMSAVAIGPGTSVTLKPGGTHIMILGLKQQLREGQTFPLTLEFETAGKIELQVPIAKAGAMGDHDMSGRQAQ